MSELETELQELIRQMRLVASVAENNDHPKTSEVVDEWADELEAILDNND